ncbi:MAG: Yersiniabactin transcriptional regulator YbtA, partial [Escherichia coli DORA_A_5_14_21]
IDSHCCCTQPRCNAEPRLTAQALRHALMRMHGGFSHEQKPSTLWLQGQSLVMLSLVLDEHREDASCLSCHFNPMERQKLLRAKDLLLDFGPRQFTVSFDETLKPFVRDVSGSRLKDLPKPNKSDDETRANDAVNRYKLL